MLKAFWDHWLKECDWNNYLRTFGVNLGCYNIAEVMWITEFFVKFWISTETIWLFLYCLLDMHDQDLCNLKKVAKPFTKILRCQDKQMFFSGQLSGWYSSVKECRYFWRWLCLWLWMPRVILYLVRHMTSRCS